MLRWGFVLSVGADGNVHDLSFVRVQKLCITFVDGWITHNFKFVSISTLADVYDPPAPVVFVPQSVVTNYSVGDEVLGAFYGKVEDFFNPVWLDTDYLIQCEV
jgi:hypothetical protein